MRVAIFENEAVEVEGAFKVVNSLFFKKQIAFEYFPSSQAIGDIDKVKLYDLVLVDLDLSKKSLLDGYALIRNILAIHPTANIIILTGAFENEVLQKLHDKGLPELPIIKKPVDLDDINAKFKKSFGSKP